MIEPISIDIASLNIPSLVPMMVAIVGALVILCIDLFTKYEDKYLYVILTILFLFLDLGTIIGYSGPSRGFFEVMLVDGISIFAQSFIVIASGFFILLALSKQNVHEYRYPEYFALFLFMTAGFQFMVASDNLILIFVGLETASISLYIMIAMHNTNKSLEAAIKYFTMGAMASAFFAMGSLVFYYVTGSVELGVISEYLVKNSFEPYLVILLGLVFMIAALGFKLSLFPFHSWAPDVYEGSNTALVGYIAIVPKIAALVVAIRFFQIFVGAENVWLHEVLYLIAVVTMTIPNIMALVQSDVKRMLAYSSISHAGFVLVAIMIGSTQALESLFLYWIMFSFVIFGSFAMLWIVQTKEKSSYYGFGSDYDFAKFTGLVKTSPLAAFLLAAMMFGLAGIPPFSMFWGKMHLISATVNSGEILLAIIMVLNSAIAAFYYLKLIVYMFLKEKNENGIDIVYNNMGTTILTIIISISAILTVTSIFWVGMFLDIITHALQSSGY